MEKNNFLINMTDFVLNQKQSVSFNEKTFINESLISLEKIRNYANFLKQPLKLEMFVPFDDEGIVLEEPKKTNYQVDVNTKCSGWKYLYDSNDKLIGYYDDRKWKEDFEKHKQAKEKVLFENIPISQAKWLVNSFSTIESLSDVSNTITPIYLNNNAIKQIGL